MRLCSIRTKPEEHIVAADYVSDQMSDEARQDADRHLALCSDCRDAVEAVRAKQRESSTPAAEVTPVREKPPLRVLLPRVAVSFRALPRFIGRFGIVVALTAAVLLLPAAAGITAEAQRGLAL